MDLVSLTIDGVQVQVPAGTTVLEAARLAPSACNSQPYHFYVAVDGTARAVGAATQSLGMNKFAGDCPAFIVVAEQPYNRSAAVGAKLKDQDYRAADIGLAGKTEYWQ